jgi:hypothetical protein
MKNRTRCPALLLVAALAPLPASAQSFLGLDFSDIKLTAFTSVSTQLQPIKTDTDTSSAPKGSVNAVDALVVARGIPFPNFPNSVGSAFASSAGDNNGLFGVGVNGFFFTNSLPPDALLASVTFSQTITNNSTSNVSIFAGVTIPAPTILLFGVGNSFPAGADPRRDVAASVNASFLTRITHPDGTVVDGQPLDYGISLFRQPISGVLFAIDADGALLTKLEDPDGSFGFQLPNFQADNLLLAEIAPGDVLELTLDYFASASTGFGETGIFAAIGDPFDLRAGGVRFDLQVGAPTSPAPEPETWAMLGAGLMVLVVLRRRTALNSART